MKPRLIGPFKICDRVDDGVFIEGTYFTVFGDGPMGTLWVYWNGLSKPAWFYEGATATKSLARALLWELWKHPDAPDVHEKK